MWGKGREFGLGVRGRLRGFGWLVCRDRCWGKGEGGEGLVGQVPQPTYGTSKWVREPD